MTSDGIADADWERVHELAVEIANHSVSDEEAAEARSRRALLALLAQLDKQYGLKPSLLATRADYVESPETREGLLQLAYAEAKRIEDRSNQILIAHSLAEFYVEETDKFDPGAAWLSEWREQLGPAATDEDQSEVTRLEGLLSARRAR